jgi:hypothetical protein
MQDPRRNIYVKEKSENSCLPIGLQELRLETVE